jgi:hypothetical protein
VEEMLMDNIIKGMKEGIPLNPILKNELDKMVADGLSEDEALDVMILAWLNHERRGDFE